MKRLLTLSLLTLAAVVLVAGPAAAQGINLNWDDCTLGTSAADKTDACDSNFGSPNKLILSLEPGGTINDVNGVNAVIDVLIEDTAVPDFWALETGGCRAGRLAADVFVGSANAPFSCPEAWSQVGQQAGGASWITEPALDSSVPGANRGRISIILAVPGTVSFDTGTAPDWYVIALNLLKASTTDCAGCATPACLVANQIRLTKPPGTPGGDVFVTTAGSAGQHVTWQGGGGINCPGAVPTKAHTWGQVKHLYR